MDSVGAIMKLFPNDPEMETYYQELLRELAPRIQTLEEKMRSSPFFQHLSPELQEYALKLAEDFNPDE
jgi:hypothetical protein